MSYKYLKCRLHYTHSNARVIQTISLSVTMVTGTHVSDTAPEIILYQITSRFILTKLFRNMTSKKTVNGHWIAFSTDQTQMTIRSHENPSKRQNSSVVIYFTFRFFLYHCLKFFKVINILTSSCIILLNL